MMEVNSGSSSTSADDIKHRFDVTKQNFESKFTEFEKDLTSPNLLFVAIDTEFTGPSCKNNLIPPSLHDSSPIEVFQNTLRTAASFTVLQLGVTAFLSTDNSTMCGSPIIAHPYNFVTAKLDTTNSGLFLDSFKVCGSNLLFLRKNGFDLNYWIDNAILFVDRNTLEQHTKHSGYQTYISARYLQCSRQYTRTAFDYDAQRLRNENKLLSQQHATSSTILSALSGSSLTTPNAGATAASTTTGGCTSSTPHTPPHTTPNATTATTTNSSAVTALPKLLCGGATNAHILSYVDAWKKSFTEWYSKKAQSKQYGAKPKILHCSDNWTINRRLFVEIFSIYGSTDLVFMGDINGNSKDIWVFQDRSAMREYLTRKLRSEYDKCLAPYRRMDEVIRVLESIENKAPITFHNGFYDVTHIYSSFVHHSDATNVTDHTLSLCLDAISNLFPYFFDTKILASRIFPRKCTELSKLYYRLNDEQKSRYSFSIINPYGTETCLHEAGYDSYITGVCFARLLFGACLQHNVSPIHSNLWMQLRIALSTDNKYKRNPTNPPYQLIVDQIMHVSGSLYASPELNLKTLKCICSLPRSASTPLQATAAPFNPRRPATACLSALAAAEKASHTKTPSHVTTHSQSMQPSSAKGGNRRQMSSRKSPTKQVPFTTPPPLNLLKTSLSPPLSPILGLEEVRDMLEGFAGLQPLFIANKIITHPQDGTSSLPSASSSSEDTLTALSTPVITKPSSQQPKKPSKFSPKSDGSENSSFSSLGYRTGSEASMDDRSQTTPLRSYTSSDSTTRHSVDTITTDSSSASEDSNVSSNSNSGTTHSIRPRIDDSTPKHIYSSAPAPSTATVNQLRSISGRTWSHHARASTSNSNSRYSRTYTYAAAHHSSTDPPTSLPVRSVLVQSSSPAHSVSPLPTIAQQQPQPQPQQPSPQLMTTSNRRKLNKYDVAAAPPIPQHISVYSQRHSAHYHPHHSSHHPHTPSHPHNSHSHHSSGSSAHHSNAATHNHGALKANPNSNSNKRRWIGTNTQRRRRYERSYGTG